MKDFPTESDWRGSWWEQVWTALIFGDSSNDLGLDGEHAYRHFFGKSHDEAVEMFRNDALSRQEDLVWMPFRCFQFYVEACIEYISSESAANDADGASGFFTMIRARLHEIRTPNMPLKARIMDTLRFLESRQEWYNAPPSIFGSFPDMAQTLLQELESPNDNRRS